MNEQQEKTFNHPEADEVQPEYELHFTNDELREIFEDENFSPEQLVLLLEKQYPDTYKQGVGAWEGYTLEQHTLMVMRQFEKYFGNSDLPTGIDKNTFRLILALHDIGKPEAIARGGKHLQHDYSQKYIQLLFERLGIDEKHTKLALILASGDPMGKYLTGRMSAVDARKVIETMAKEAGMPKDEFFEILCIYYKVDAGSYTKNAGGFESLDSLFDFNEESGQLNFAPYVQDRINQLGFKK